MMRVTTTDEPACIRIIIEGQLSSKYVEAVETCCKQALTKGKPIHLLLRNVLTMDSHGRALLRRLATKGVVLEATGVYTSHVLGAMGPAAPRL